MTALWTEHRSIAVAILDRQNPVTRRKELKLYRVIDKLFRHYITMVGLSNRQVAEIPAVVKIFDQRSWTRFAPVSPVYYPALHLDQVLIASQWDAPVPGNDRRQLDSRLAQQFLRGKHSKPVLKADQLNRLIPKILLTGELNTVFAGGPLTQTSRDLR